MLITSPPPWIDPDEWDVLLVSLRAETTAARLDGIRAKSATKRMQDHVSSIDVLLAQIAGPPSEG